MAKEEITQVQTPALSGVQRSRPQPPAPVAGATRSAGVKRITISLYNYSSSIAEVREEIVYPVDYVNKLTYPCRLVRRVWVSPLEWWDDVECIDIDHVIVRKYIYDPRIGKPIISYHRVEG